MMTFVLAMHICGGVATGVAGSYALVALYNKKTDRYYISALSLGMLAAFEILTGALLSVLSTKVSAKAVCERIALYLVLIVFLEALLFMRMRGTTMKFPARIVSSIATSLSFLAAALALGF